MKRSITAIVGFLGVIATAGCSEGGGGDAEGPIKIGVLFAATGAGQVYGAPALKGAEIAVAKINAEGGLLGRQVELVFRDDQSDPAAATTAARDLVTRDGVNFLIGGVQSAVGQAISAEAKAQQVIYIASMSKTSELIAGDNFHPYVFRAAANTNTEGKSAAIIVNRLGLDRICTLLLNYSYGTSLDESFSAHIKQLRPTAQIVYQGKPDLGTTDYSTYITNILNSGCEVVFSGLWGSNFPTFAKQAAPQGFFNRVKYVSAGEIGTPEIIEELGAEMPTGVWGNSYELFYFPDTPEHRAYVEELRAVYGRDNTPSFPIVGYMSVQWLAEAIKKAGTTETEAVRQALEGLTIDTPIGPQTMRASDHQANRGQFWGQVAESNIPNYPFKVLNPVEYIAADSIMD